MERDDIRGAHHQQTDADSEGRGLPRFSSTGKSPRTAPFFLVFVFKKEAVCLLTDGDHKWLSFQAL